MELDWAERVHLNFARPQRDPATTGSNIYTATYTNADGVNSTQTFTITIN